MLRTYSLLLALTLGLSGCASWFEDDAPPPHVALVKVEVVRAKLLEQKFKLYFRVDNRDDADLTVRGLIYKVTLGRLLLTATVGTVAMLASAHLQGKARSSQSGLLGGADVSSPQTARLTSRRAIGLDQSP